MEKYVLEIQELIQKWLDKELQNANGRSYKDVKDRFILSRDRINSYGSHWTLCYRTAKGDIVRNGDRYRGNRISDTWGHTRELETALPDSPMISFATVLQLIGAKNAAAPSVGKHIYFESFLDNCTFIETQRAYSEYRTVGDSTWEYAYPEGSEVHYTYDPDTKEPTSMNIHRIGAVLFYWKNLEGVKEYYIASADEGSYFISRLAKPAKTIAAAFEGLKPKLVHQAELQKRELLRQGEWFLIPIANEAMLAKAKAAEKTAVLTQLRKYETSTNSHQVKVAEVDGFRVAYGQMKHVRMVQWGEQKGKMVLTKEHKTVKLSEPHILVLNTSIEDYSAQSPVD